MSERVYLAAAAWVLLACWFGPRGWRGLLGWFFPRRPARRSMTAEYDAWDDRFEAARLAGKDYAEAVAIADAGAAPDAKGVLQHGPRASRPAASPSLAGSRYFSSDEKRCYLCDGRTWSHEQDEGAVRLVQGPRHGTVVARDQFDQFGNLKMLSPPTELMVARVVAGGGELPPVPMEQVAVYRLRSRRSPTAEFVRMAA